MKAKKKKYEEIWNKVRDLIRSITKNSNDYDEKYMKQQKTVREGSLEENPKVNNILTNSLDSPECLQILFNCLRNIEKKS